MTAPPTRKRSFQKRLRLTKQQELQICDLQRSFPRQTFTALASRARVALRLVKSPSLQMVSRVLKAEDELRQLAPDCLARKKQRPLYQLQLDQSMVEFVVWCETSRVSLSGAMVMLQAKRMAARHHIPDAMLPRIGESWLRRFQERYGIRFRHSHGESGAVDLGACAAEIQKLRSIIRSYAYSDVFNMDESGLFYNSVPRGSLCAFSAPALKQDKSRITMAVCTNANGSEKLPLLFIGKSATPRWFKNKSEAVQYTSTKKEWMTTTVFQSWLRDLDASMREQGRQILLLVDNASSHSDEDVTLTNIRLEKLPPNTTSKLQPLDQGIIHCLNAMY